MRKRNQKAKFIQLPGTGDWVRLDQITEVLAAEYLPAEGYRPDPIPDRVVVRTQMDSHVIYRDSPEATRALRDHIAKLAQGIKCPTRLV